MLMLLRIHFCCRQRVQICDHVLASSLDKIIRALGTLYTVLLDLHQERVAPTNHVLDNPRGADAFLRIVLVERKLGVSSTDVEYSNGSKHFTDPRLLG